MNGLVVRGALLGLALLAGAWLLVGVRGVRLIDDGDAVIAKAQAGHATPAEIDDALADYARAGRLSPDQTPLVQQGALLLAAGRADQARAKALSATRVEPDNLQAWLLAFAASGDDPEAKRHAKAEILKLNPWFLYVLTRRSPT